MTSHKLLTAEECRKTHSDHDTGSCNICDGGLSYCTVCHGAEACLPTDCPGRPLTEDEVGAIMVSKLDFVNGEWVQESNFKKYDILGGTE